MTNKQEVHQTKAHLFAAQVENVLTGLTNVHLGDYTVTMTSDPKVVRSVHNRVPMVSTFHYRVTFIIDSSVEGFIAMATFMSDGTANVVSPGPTGSTGLVNHLTAFAYIRTKL